MRAPALDRSVSLQSTVGRDVVPIRADAHRLHQVLLNLVSNAIKYNRPDGAVTISDELLDGCVRLAVTDPGRGVPAHLAGQRLVPFPRLGAEVSPVGAARSANGGERGVQY